ncbi:hypothetical protein [Clostridium sp. AWRP]|uniref:prenylated flavin chaperone LpdD n=1 Tax=Clostridium sp. AWRP TaxID=2212991 RepID=UPI00325B2B2E
MINFICNILILNKAFAIRKDLCVIISGGDIPHIDSVTLSIPRPSLSDSNKRSATMLVLNLFIQMNITNNKLDS